MMWMPLLIAGLMLFVADMAGWIDLNSNPFTRAFKWLAITAWAWFLPIFIKRIFHFEFNPDLIQLWKLVILGVLVIALMTTLVKWLWKHFGPAPEGHRRCPRCSIPVLKVMLECPHCRHTLDSRK